MTAVAFFPWIRPERPISFAEFRLLPFERQRAPVGGEPELQATIDAVFDGYTTATGAVVKHATVLTHGDRGAIAPLTEVERDDYFEFAELLAFSTLAPRKYFSNAGYINRDHYRLLIQGVESGRNTVVITSRRRDGSHTNAYPSGTFVEPRPPHVPAARMVLDEPLLEALLVARESPDWDRYYEAIVGFNIANTDNPYFTLENEIVNVMGAIQRLVACESSKDKELVARVDDYFVPRVRVGIGTCTDIKSTDDGITSRFRNGSTVTAGWLLDLSRVRHRPAHGKLRANYPSLWNASEHLLLAGYFFPLLVKAVLEADGLYTLTEDDCVDIDLFEELACARHFESRDADRAGPGSWGRIRGAVRRGIMKMREGKRVDDR